MSLFTNNLHLQSVYMIECFNFVNSETLNEKMTLVIKEVVSKEKRGTLGLHVTRNNKYLRQNYLHLMCKIKVFTDSVHILSNFLFKNTF